MPLLSTQIPVGIARPRLTPLTLAIHMAMAVPLVMSASAPAVAQSAARSIDYDIPAGPLADALNRFAQQSGVAIVLDSSRLQGLRAPGLQGRYGIDEGFAILLRGSGYAAAQTASGYVLRAATTSSGATTSVLPTVKVQDTVSDGTTEGTGSYTTDSTSSATRLDLSLRQTPQTITVVTRQTMDDFNLDSINDVLSSTSGVYVFTRGSNGSFYYSRGFFMQSQYDGIPVTNGLSEWNRNPPPDSALFDRVEVLQGASGLLSGAGDPGGTVNMVRKRPTADFQASVELGLGSWDGKRLVGDIAGPLNSSGALRARAVVALDDRDAFADHGYDRVNLYYGVLEADLGERTMLTAMAQFQRNESRTHYGMPAAPDGSDLNLPRSTFFGAKWGTQEKENGLYTLRLDQELGAEWTLRAAYMHGETHVDGWQVYTWDTEPLDVGTGDGLDLNYSDIVRRFDNDSADIYATGPVRLFGRTHELVFGLNGTRMDGDYRSAYDYSLINIYTYRYDSIPQPDLPLSDWDADDYMRQYGFYTAGRFSLSDPLKVILGGRVSWYEDNYGGKESGVISPYAGVVFDLNAWSSIYASYSDIFMPQTALKKDGSTIDPVVGNNYEIGIKGEFHDGRLNAALALFRLEQTNLAKEDPSVPFDPDNICGGYCYLASDLVFSQGVDLSVNGEVLNDWQLMAGYTYVHREYGSGASDGRAYGTDQPEHILRVSTLYRLPGDHWSVGGNVRVQSKIYNEGDTFRTQQDAVSIVGLTAGYNFTEKSELSLQIDNLFDEKYYDTIGYPGYANFYGEPRKFWVSFKQSF